MKQKSSPVIVTEANRAAIERLCYHYGKRAFIIGNEPGLFCHLAQDICNVTNDSKMDLDEVATGIKLLKNLYEQHGLDKHVATKYRNKMPALFEALESLFIDLIESPQMYEALITIGTDAVGLDKMSNADLANHFSHMRDSYLSAMELGIDESGEVYSEEFNARRISDLEKEITQNSPGLLQPIVHSNKAA